jgi:HEAT repeat protein
VLRKDLSCENINNLKEDMDLKNNLNILKGDYPIFRRRDALFIIKKLKGEEVENALLDTLKNDTSPDLRHEAAFALYERNSLKAIVPLIEAFENDPHPLVKHETAEALGLFGDERAIEPLKKGLKEADEVVRGSIEIALDSIMNRLRNQEGNKFKNIECGNPEPKLES